MSHRPLTTGVSAGSSLAIALKLLDWDHKDLLSLYNQAPASSNFHTGSFLLGLVCGLVLYFSIEWLVTLRWAVIEWVHSATAGSGQVRRKELYKLL